MAYLILTANGEEFDRRELIDGAGVVVGRAPDCDISVPDIVLSRHHCRLEPAENRVDWQIVDLHSRNGTFIRGKAIASHELRDGDELRIGRTRLTFCEGPYVAPTSATRKRAFVRPADPSDALAGTVTGMVLCEPDEVERQEGKPFPQPRPTDPKSYAAEDLYGMINEIASSSWDSIMAQNSQPIRMQRAMPVPAVTRAHRGSVRPKQRVAFCLQAQDREQGAIFTREDSRSIREDVTGVRTRTAQVARAPRARRPWMYVTSSLVGTGLFVVTWVSLILGGNGNIPLSLPAAPSRPPVVTPSPPQDNGAPAAWDAVAELA